MVANAEVANKNATSAALAATKNAPAKNASNGIEKPVDFRVMQSDDTKMKRSDDTKINTTNGTNFAGGALRKLAGIGKRITPTMRLTTYVSGGIKYFRYQESSAALRKINPPVHLAPYNRRKGKDKLDYDNRTEIEEFKAKRKAKGRRRKGGSHRRAE